MPDDLTQYRDDVINSLRSCEKQAKRNEIYQLLMENAQYFRDNGMFDSDDDIECEIDSIEMDINNGDGIYYCSKNPPKEFDEKLNKLFDEYINIYD